jgi:hypothetical protein
MADEIISVSVSGLNTNSKYPGLDDHSFMYADPVLRSHHCSRKFVSALTFLPPCLWHLNVLLVESAPSPKCIPRGPVDFSEVSPASCSYSVDFCPLASFPVVLCFVFNSAPFLTLFLFYVFCFLNIATIYLNKDFVLSFHILAFSQSMMFFFLQIRGKSFVMVTVSIGSMIHIKTFASSCKECAWSARSSSKLASNPTKPSPKPHDFIHLDWG